MACDPQLRAPIDIREIEGLSPHESKLLQNSGEDNDTPVELEDKQIERTIRGLEPPVREA